MAGEWWLFGDDVDGGGLWLMSVFGFGYGFGFWRFVLSLRGGLIFFSGFVTCKDLCDDMDFFYWWFGYVWCFDEILFYQFIVSFYYIVLS